MEELLQQNVTAGLRYCLSGMVTASREVCRMEEAVF